MASEAKVTKMGFWSMHCVPKDWTDEQVVSFAEKEYPCGTTNGWQIRRQGDKALAGCDERVQCEGKGREDRVYLMLDV
jgi:hypothetical protein